MVVEPGSSVRTIDCADSQRKNAANKLQDSGLATVVVYHIRHRVLHHIDSTKHVHPDPMFRASKRQPVLSEPYRSVGLILRIPAPLRLETFSAPYARSCLPVLFCAGRQLDPSHVPNH